MVAMEATALTATIITMTITAARITSPKTTIAHTTSRPTLTMRTADTTEHQYMKTRTTMIETKSPTMGNHKTQPPMVVDQVLLQMDLALTDQLTKTTTTHTTCTINLAVAITRKAKNRDCDQLISSTCR